MKLYDIDLIEKTAFDKYDSIILAVQHTEFIEMGPEYCTRPPKASSAARLQIWSTPWFRSAGSS